MTIQVRSAVLGAAVLAVLISAAACTQGGGPSRPRRAAGSTAVSATGPGSASAPAPGAGEFGVDGARAALHDPPCERALPPSWQSALRKGLLWPKATDQLPTNQPIRTARGVGVLAQHATRAGVRLSILGPDRAVLSTVGTIPLTDPAQQGGIAYSWADDTHLVFIYNVQGEQAQNIWWLYSWPLAGGPLTLIARNPTGPGGRPINSGWVHPFVDGDTLYWIQATLPPKGFATLPAGSELMQYHYSTGRSRVLYRGLTTAFVVYHDRILFTGLPLTPGAKVDRVTGNPPLILRAVNTVSGRPAAVPPGLTAAADSAYWIVTNGDMIVWDTADDSLRGWRPAWGKSVTIFPGLLHKRPSSFADIEGGNPRLWGPYLIWSDHETFVLDLRTDAFVRLNEHPSAGEVHGSLVTVWQQLDNSKADPDKPFVAQVMVLDLATLPALPACKGD